MIARLDIASLPEVVRPAMQRFLDLIKDEPWVFGLPHAGEQEFLGEFGLELRDMLAIGSEDSIRRYATCADGTAVGAAAIAAAMAQFAARMKEAGQPPPAPEGGAADRMRARQPMMSYQLAEAFVP